MDREAAGRVKVSPGEIKEYGGDRLLRILFFVI